MKTKLSTIVISFIITFLMLAIFYFVFKDYCKCPETTVVYSKVPPGTIMAFAGDTTKVPEGWLLCNGDTISRIGKYNNLFNAIGTHWGGQGANEFKIPNLQGQFLRGADNGFNIDPDAALRFDFNNKNNIIGDKVGSFQNDAFQGHQHNYLPYINCEGPLRHGAAYGGEAKSCKRLTDNILKGNYQEDPRISSETRPKNAYVNWIIKY